jgi:SAM-dependent methyltransferase
VRRVSAPSDRIAIAGAGASALVVDLASQGYSAIVAIDLAAPALEQLRGRLGDDAERVAYICDDVRDVVLDEPVVVWHDRATFHFLTAPDDQRRYVERVADAVAPGGVAIIATFAEHGAEQCSGLPVARHSSGALGAHFVDSFEHVESHEHVHLTPWGAEQPFTYVVLRRRDR